MLLALTSLELIDIFRWAYGLLIDLANDPHGCRLLGPRPAIIVLRPGYDDRFGFLHPAQIQPLTDDSSQTSWIE